jgi:small GTP-binding protein
MSTGKFDEDTIPTIGFNFRTMKKGKVSLKLWDLGGQPRFRESWEKYCRTADVIVFVVDSSDLAHIEDAKVQLTTLLNWPTLYGIPLLVLGNKNDVKGSLTAEELIKKLDLAAQTERKVACYSISAKNNVNIDLVLQWLTDLPRRER